MSNLELSKPELENGLILDDLLIDQVKEDIKASKANNTLIAYQ